MSGYKDCIVFLDPDFLVDQQLPQWCEKLCSIVHSKAKVHTSWLLRAGNHHNHHSVCLHRWTFALLGLVAWIITVQQTISRLSAQLMKALDNAMLRLHQIWDRIGIGKSQKEERSSTVLRHLQSLLDDMVEEEETLEKQILGRVQAFTEELKKLTTELEVPAYHSKPGMTVLQIEKELRTKIEHLRKEKQERLKILKTLKEEEQLLCDSLCMTPYYIQSNTTPTGEQLETLRQHIAKLTAEKEKRFSTFLRQKKQISDLMLEMDRSPETSFEKDVVCEEDSEFILSQENMHSLDALVAELISSKAQLEKEVTRLWDRVHVLWERLDVPLHEQELFSEGKEGFKPKVIEELREEITKCEALKLQNIRRFIEGIRQELEEWWGKCFYSDKQRREFKYLHERNFSEDLLEKHEAEVARLKQYYDTHEEVLSRVGKREELFNQMIEFEKKANDPNRFFHDRGGKLLLEEKARKKLMKELPKVEEQVKEEILEWEKEHGRKFFIYGVCIQEHMERSWKEFNENKLKEKEERQKAKTKLMEEEMIYGSKPSTPVKRRFANTNTPTKTPKYRKMNETKTPVSCSRIQNSTRFASPLHKAPLSTSKVPQASKLMSSTSKTAPGSIKRRRSRRSNRLVRKALGEKNEGTNDTLFSHTTVSSGAGVTTGGNNISLASTGSYQDFAVGLNPSARPFCRSSIAHQPPSPGRKIDLHRL